MLLLTGCGGGNGLPVPTLSFATIAAQTYGNAPFTVSATSASTGAVTYAVVSGPATVSGNTVSLTGAGTVVLSASQASTPTYAAVTVSTSFIVAPATPSLSFATIGTQTYGAAPFTVSATSASTGAVTYSVTSGPATVSGNTVTLTGAGTVVLGASQAATSSYATATASTSFTVAPATPSLSFTTIAAKTYGAAPFTVSATSASSGAVTYSVVSGPAQVSGNIVGLTGAGMVMLQASQAAAGNYTATTATTNFLVSTATPTLSFAAIATQIATNAPFTVSATSASTGAVTYAVTSGPASITGSTLTLSGTAGTVYLSASQAATTNYAAATANTSFSVVTTGALGGTAFSGTVQAAGLPVIGASVQLYEVGTSGNGSRSNAKLASALTTDSNGNFNVPSSYSCVSSTTSLFLVAKGGKVGSTGTVNSSLWLMSAILPCGSIGNTFNFMLNELTTVASASALAQFYGAGGNIGATASNALGLSNAIVTQQLLVNTFTGNSPGALVTGNVTVNSAKLNSLADAFSACAVSSASCAALFAAATVGTTVPTNTLDAAFAIERHPGNNVATLYALSTGTTFTPTLTTAPPDWMMFLTVSGYGLSSPTAIAVDGYGNIWAANYSGTLAEFQSRGAPDYSNGISGNGLHESFGMAIDASNNIWVVNDETPGSPGNGGTLTKFTNGGVALSGTIGYTTGLYFPTGIASDTNGNMWIANYGNSTFALYQNSGVPASITCNVNGCGYGELEFPVAAASDSNHTGWMGNQSANTVTRISPDGTSVVPINCCSGSSGLAVDAQNNVWSANYFGDSISEISSIGTVISSGYSGGGIYHPQGIAVDGAGSIWVANYRGGSITELAGATAVTPGAALSPASIGYGSDAGLIEPYGLAVDSSGSVWVSNYAENTLVEFVGIAVPVKTPLVGPPQIP